MILLGSHVLSCTLALNFKADLLMVHGAGAS